MKKLFIFLLLGVLLVGTLGLFLFKPSPQINVEEQIKYPQLIQTENGLIEKNYNQLEKEVSLKNDLTKEQILTAKLDTPHVYQVGLGYQKIAQFTINPYQDYNNVLGQFEFYDLNDNNEKIERQIDVKYLGIEDYLVDNYSCDNKTGECSVSWSHTGQREAWLDWDKNVVSNEKVVVGLFTEVGVEETIEWIPTIAGVKVEEWAVFTSGATTTTDGAYTVVKYINNGTFNTTGNLNISYLIVAGGAGGADGGSGGGGGSGGMLSNNTGYTLVTGNYNIKVGIGGANGTVGQNGQNSSIIFFNGTKVKEALGGGGGGTYNSGSGSDGGSGGGGGAGSRPGGAGTSGQGNSGGTGSSGFNAGGGGGAGAVGGNGGGTNGGDGGNGLTSTILNGTALYYSGGGGGDGSTPGNGGLGGGGAGSNTQAGNGTANSGGGGGAIKGYGGSGIVIIRYLTTLVSNINIDLISPVNNTNFSTNNINLLANVINSTGTNLQNVSLLINGVINETNTSRIKGIYNFSKTFVDGNRNWTVIAFGNDSVQYNASNGTMVFTVDTIFPKINISSPPTGTNFNYLTQGQNFTLNTTINDTNLNICLYNYNLSNTTFTCSSNVLRTNYFNLTNQANIIVYANDTVGNQNSTTSIWTFNLFDFINYTSSPNITESSSTTITGHFQTGSSLSSAFLQYNNTNYSSSINSLGGNIYILSAIVTSPLVTSDNNISWFFWVNNVNATKFNQTVLNINLDNCSSFIFPIVNYTLQDEAQQTSINNSNSTIETTIILRSIQGSNVAEFNKLFNGTISPSVCSQTNLTNSGLRIWEQSRYGSTNYVFEQHNIQNQSMTTLPANFTLLNLLSASATTFRIIYKSSSFLPVRDAVIDIQRKYLGEGVFKSIELPITDANGEVSASFDLNAVLYRILVKQNGTTLSTFENPAVSCANILTGDCNINLNERASVTLINNYDVENDFNWGLTQNNRTITLTYDIPSGTAKTINLYVNQSTILGNSTACNQTLFATSGQLQCTIASSLGDVFATSTVKINGATLVIGSSTILEDRSTYFGTDNIVLTFFLVLSLILLMISDPIAVLFGIILGLLGSSLMLLLNSGSPFGTIPVLTYFIIVILILIVKIAMRRDRGI